MKEDILGYSVDTLSSIDCCEEIVDSVTRGQKGWLACFNPHSYAVSLKDNVFSSALSNANWLVPDGIGVVYASKFLRGGVKERVTGFDIFKGVHDRLINTNCTRVFFLGSTDDTLLKIRKRMQEDYPELQVVGFYSPPFKLTYTDTELQEMISAINDVKPDVVWVGLTAPKQEKWILNNISKLDVKFVGAIGAVFDFYTGQVKRSSPIFQKLGLEWLPRLIQQPKRLWRRMFISAPVFVVDVFKEKFASK